MDLARAGYALIILLLVVGISAPIYAMVWILDKIERGAGWAGDHLADFLEWVLEKAKQAERAGWI